MRARSPRVSSLYRLRPADQDTNGCFWQNAGLGGALHTVRTTRGTNRLGVATRPLGPSFQVLRLYASRAKFLGANAFYREQSCAFFEAVEGFCPEPLHFQQFLPMSEVAVALAVAHDVVGDVFGDAGQLGQFLRAGGIQIDDVSHRNPLDGGSKRCFTRLWNDNEIREVGQQCGSD